jgi:hypothetical protein
VVVAGLILPLARAALRRVQQEAQAAMARHIQVALFQSMPVVVAARALPEALAQVVLAAAGMAKNII